MLEDFDLLYNDRGRGPSTVSDTKCSIHDGTSSLITSSVCVSSHRKRETYVGEDSKQRTFTYRNVIIARGDDITPRVHKVLTIELGVIGDQRRSNLIQSTHTLVGSSVGIVVSPDGVSVVGVCHPERDFLFLTLVNDGDTFEYELDNHGIVG